MKSTDLHQPTKPEAFLTRFANLPILSVKRNEWRMEQQDHDHNDANPLFQEKRKKVLERDGRKCWFCGFASTANQEIHHLNGDHTDNEIDNLATICNVDHLCFHLGLAALKSAVFIAFVPELTQPEITNLMRVYHSAMFIGNTEIKESLKGFYSMFEARSVPVFSQVFKSDFSSGHEIAMALSKLEDAQFSNRAKTFEGLRVIPTAKAFQEDQISSYVTRTHSQYFDMKHWPSLLDTLRAQPD